MKGWFDRVLAMGVAWDGGQIYERGLLKGKQAMMVVNGGHPKEYYQENAQHKMTALQMLHTINHGVLAFCGMNVHESFIALNVLGEDATEREAQLAELRFRIQNIFTSPNWLINQN
jgi:NAD(P)H dehydrogenase (quinone)